MQTDFKWYKLFLSEKNRFYPIETEFIWDSSNQTDQIIYSSMQKNDTNRFYPIQTDFIRYKLILSDTNRFYPIQTDFILVSSIQTDCTTNITIRSDFSYSRTKVPRPPTTTTTDTLLGPRCSATRGQKWSKSGKKWRKEEIGKKWQKWINLRIWILLQIPEEHF